jgi:hypothetical protein
MSTQNLYKMLALTPLQFEELKRTLNIDSSIQTIQERHDIVMKRNLRIEAIRKLGGRCSRCGYSDYRALQFDHVNGNGSSESTNTAAFLRKVVVGAGKDFQLLCANCNSIKRCERGEGCRSDLNEFFLKSMEKEKLVFSFC